jgi:hypothetical protein
MGLEDPSRSLTVITMYIQALRQVRLTLGPMH